MEDTRRPRRPIIIPALLALTAVLLIVADRRADALGPLRQAGSVVYGRLEAAAVTFAQWTTGAERVKALERENARLRAELLVARQRESVAARTAALPGTRLETTKSAYSVLPAQVIAFSGRRGTEQTVTIDAGTADGVTRDVTVMNAAGLVGRVTQVGPASATVLLATDASSSVGTRMADTGEVGLVTGLPADGMLRLRLLNPRARLEVGQPVLTLGSDNLRPYVPGVPIGRVVGVERTPGALTRTALVRPFAALTTLDVVAVVVPGRQAGQGETATTGPKTAEAGTGVPETGRPLPSRSPEGPREASGSDVVTTPAPGRERETDPTGHTAAETGGAS